MRLLSIILLLFCCQGIASCNKKLCGDCGPGNGPYRIVKNITFNGLSVDVVIDKPANDTVDVLMTYHGTVSFDDRILEAAQNTLDGFKRILNRTDMMLVSVAYPEENLLMGDNVAHSEAALLWVRERASQELGIVVRKIFLAGHSQGGYIVTRLNTLHAVNGVIANAPGPLNLVYRCELEANGQVATSRVCTQLAQTYGGPTVNPTAYMQRSLLTHTSGFKSDILFVQGLSDSPIQLYSWPTFKQSVNDCTTCRERIFLDIPGYGHTSLFESPEAKTAFNQFIQSR
jgi:poly(3-hydroxybutyrate) depolymerase